MEMSMVLLFFIIFLFIFILIVRIPIIIAKNRGVGGADLTTIAVLSWLGILFGLTWIAALILALLYEPSVSTSSDTKPINADELSQLYALKEQGALSEDEYNRYKKKFLKGR